MFWIHNLRFVLYSLIRILGEDGQIGIGDTSDQNEPCLVESLRDVSILKISCGSGHTVVLSTEGSVYSWGRGDDGRLG